MPMPPLWTDADPELSSLTGSPRSLLKQSLSQRKAALHRSHQPLTAAGVKAAEKALGRKPRYLHVLGLPRLRHEGDAAMRKALSGLCEATTLREVFGTELAFIGPAYHSPHLLQYVIVGGVTLAVPAALAADDAELVAYVEADLESLTGTRAHRGGTVYAAHLLELFHLSDEPDPATGDLLRVVSLTLRVEVVGIPHYSGRQHARQMSRLLTPRDTPATPDRDA